MKLRAPIHWPASSAGTNTRKRVKPSDVTSPSVARKPSAIVSVAMKNAISDARPIATPAGELKKKITIGGPPIPSAPFNRPEIQPVAIVCAALGIVLLV